MQNKRFQNLKEIEEGWKCEITEEEWTGCENWTQLTLKTGNKFYEIFREVDGVLKGEETAAKEQGKEESGKTEEEAKESAPDTEMESKEETQLALLKLATTDPKEFRKQELAETHEHPGIFPG